MSIQYGRDLKVINELLILAEDVVLVNKSRNRYRLAAAIVKKRKVLSYGINNYQKTHPEQAKYRKHEEANFMCAEVRAITNAKRRYGEEELKGATIYIARIKYTDSKKSSKVPGLAKPCVGCAQHINELGISRVVYTNDDSGFTCEEVGE